MRDEERFDRWFKSLPLRQQAELRRKGVIPYREMPVDDNVFPVVENHVVWSTTEPEDKTESSSFMSEDVVRERLAAIFCVLEKFSDRQMRLHLRFIRAMLGSGECETLANLSRDFGITKQAMTWRARQVRAALGRLAVGSGVKTAMGPSKESSSGGGDKRVATRPGVVKRVVSKNHRYLANGRRSPQKR